MEFNGFGALIGGTAQAAFAKRDFWNKEAMNPDSLTPQPAQPAGATVPACDSPTEAKKPVSQNSQAASDPLAILSTGLRGMLRAARRYGVLRAARTRLAVQQAVVRIAAYVALGLFVFVVALTGAIFMMLGFAKGIAQMSGRPWLGYFLAGFTVLFLIVLVGLIGARIARLRSYQKAVEQYAQQEQ